MAARDASGKLWLEIANLDPEKPVTLDTEITAVVPKPASANLEDGRLALTVEPKSVTVISLEAQ